MKSRLYQKGMKEGRNGRAHLNEPWDGHKGNTYCHNQCVLTVRCRSHRPEPVINQRGES